MPTPDDEKPDPEAEAVLGKVKRLMAISLLFTGIAVAAVFAVIGYRVFTGEGSRPAGAAIEADVPLPKGARVIATAVAGDRIVVTIEIEGRTEVRVFDLATLDPRGSLRFPPAP
jgi:hypothetical protein